MRIEYAPTQDGAHEFLAVANDVDANLLLRACAVRKPGAYRGQRSKPGWYSMASTRQLVSFESKLERTALLHLDFLGTVTAVVPQPFRVHFDRLEAPKRHVPDYLVGYSAARPQLVDVKGASQLDQPVIRAAFDLTGRMCNELGWNYLVFSDSNPTKTENLAYLAGYRGPLLTPLDGMAYPLMQLLAQRTMTVDDALDVLRRADVVQGLAPAVLWRAVWTRRIKLDLNKPLSGSSVVTLPFTVRAAA